jgi:hypothetical protein
LILQTLSTIVSLPSGAQEFMKLEDVSSLTEIAPQQPLIMAIYSLAWSNASTEQSEIPAVKASIDNTLPLLLVSFSQSDAVTLLAFIGDAFPQLPPEVLFIRVNDGLH